MRHEETWIAKEGDNRPAGPPDRCFYCDVPLGTRHKDDCVIPRRTVVVRMTVEYPVTVPTSWTPDEITFHRNDSSWCCSNAVAELEKFDCICGRTKFEYVGEADADEDAAFREADMRARAAGGAE